MYNCPYYGELIILLTLSPQYGQLSTAHQLSFYWEGDLRNLSYFQNKKKNLSLKLKSCRPSIFGHTGERESAQNNRITGKLTVLKRKLKTIHSLKTL